MAVTLHQLRKRARAGLLACLVAAVTAGCSTIETDITADWDADRLYNEARDAVENSDWTRAQDYYTKLESRYPFGRYAQQAQIESAYAYWRDYERDADAARTAFDTFKEIVERFPNSRYAHEARRRMHELVLAQAYNELKVARFYYDRHAYVAAIERAQGVVREFQQTPYSDDALKLIEDCYEQLGITELQADVRRVIDLNQNRER